MKKLLLITCLIISSSLFAQETHSPIYTCTDINGTQKLLLLGNEFPQIEDLDWSNELKLATFDEYYTGTTSEKNHYNIFKNLHGTLSTEINMAGRSLILNKASNSLKVLKDNNVVEYYECTELLLI